MVKILTNENDGLKKGLWIQNKNAIGMSSDVLSDPIYFDKSVFIITNRENRANTFE